MRARPCVSSEPSPLVTASASGTARIARKVVCNPYRPMKLAFVSPEHLHHTRLRTHSTWPACPCFDFRMLAWRTPWLCRHGWICGHGQDSAFPMLVSRGPPFGRRLAAERPPQRGWAEICRSTTARPCPSALISTSPALPPSKRSGPTCHTTPSLSVPFKTLLALPPLKLQTCSHL